MIISLLVVLALIAVDQLSKLVALDKLKDGASIVVIKGLLSLTYVENRGAAYGMLQGGRIFFIPLTLIVLGCIIYYYIKLPKTKVYTWVRVAMVLITAGAIGNLIDRAFRGFVVDFFQFTFIEFPVFNVADSCIVVGTIFLAILLLFFVKDESPLKSA